MVNLNIIILIAALIVVGTLYWCGKKVESGEITCGMNLWDITRSEFDKLINKRKFSALNSWVDTPYLFQFFAGKFNELETCIFSIGKDRYCPPTMGVLITSLNLPFPNFIVRPKSLTREVGDMLGMCEHYAAIPEPLIDKYDVSSEDDGRFAAKLTPEIVSLFLDSEGVSVEYLNGALLINPPLISEDKNYEPAVQLAHAFAQTLGSGIAKQEREVPRMINRFVLYGMVCLVAFTMSACGSGGGAPIQTASEAKALTAFSFTTQVAAGSINESNKTIAVTVPYGTDATKLVAAFTTTGATVKVGSTVQVSGSSANDFSSPVSYVVTAEDGSSASYIVTVTVADASTVAKAITAFSVASPAVTGVIDQGAMTIKAFVPYGTDLTTLTAAFTTTGASVTVGSTVQQSGATVNNFTNPLAYTVTAKDGSTATYTVRVMLGSYVHLESDSGDYIGQGATYTYTKAAAVLGNSATGTLLTTTVQGDQSWSGYFQVPNSLSQLQAGTYSNLTRYPFNSSTTGGLSWSGEGRGCNTLTGWFAVDNVSYNNGSLDALDLHFEQHCEGVNAALRGWIHWIPGDTTTPPAPANPPPAGLWQPASGSTPATGNYVYLQSDAGDYIGAGKTYTYTPGSTSVTLGTTGGLLNVGINGTDVWSGNFKTMNTLTQLQPGYYGNLERYPFNNPARGGLSWSGNGRGCNTLTGWFMVDSVAYNNGTLSAVDLRFEQHCEGGIPALHGQIHWVQ